MSRDDGRRQGQGTLWEEVTKVYFALFCCYTDRERDVHGRKADVYGIVRTHDEKDDIVFLAECKDWRDKKVYPLKIVRIYALACRYLRDGIDVIPILVISGFRHNVSKQTKDLADRWGVGILTERDMVSRTHPAKGMRHAKSVRGESYKFNSHYIDREDWNDFKSTLNDFSE